MSIGRGKIHKYWGMILDYSARGQVRITLIDYIDEILSAFGKADSKGLGTKTSAAPENLFKTDKDCEKLQPDKTVEFQYLAAKTLYATKRARPGTCTAITFLITRVRTPDRHDWKRLTHLMKYMRGRVRSHLS
jgi:hypothetical protein